MTAPRKPTHPWLFVLTGIPYGVGGAFTSQLMPNFAEGAGYDLGNIGWFTTLLFVPTWVQFLYTPLLDLGFSRRRWLIGLSLGGALCFAVACMIPLQTHLNAFLACAFAGQVISGLVASCNGGLMATTIPDEHRGTAGSAYNIGNISGGGIVVYLLIRLHDTLGPWGIAALTVSLMVLPSLAVLAITEPPREKKKGVFRLMLRDVAGVLFTKSGITGILLMLSPVGAAALTNSFAGVNSDWGASDSSTALVNGPIAAVLTALGAWGGGWLCDRQSRRAMYLLSGVLTAIAALGFAQFALTPKAYVVGVSAYYLVTGFCFAAFTATVLETIGHGDAAAATKYTLFTAAGNVAITYTNFADTRAYQHWGRSPVALLSCDALLNLAGVAVLAVVFWRLGAFGAKRHPPEQITPN